MKSEIVGIVTFPEGTAALNLHNLVETTGPVIVEYGGLRFALTGWNEDAGCFLGIVVNEGETPWQARERVNSGTPPPDLPEEER